MKIKLECKEVIYHSVEINTADYDIEDNPFALAEFINFIKENPKGFINENTDSSPCAGHSDIEDLKLIDSK